VNYAVSPFWKGLSLTLLGLLQIFGALSFGLGAPKIYKRFLKRGLGKNSSPKEFFPNKSPKEFPSIKQY
jgi:hypothetical protein